MNNNTNIIASHFDDADFEVSNSGIALPKKQSIDSLVKPSDWFEVPYGEPTSSFPEKWQALNSNGSENAIITTDLPHGEQGLVWECKSSGNGSADGGFNVGGGKVEVDISYAYRMSCWMRRAGTIQGTNYLGLKNFDSNGNTIGTHKLSNGVASTNFYFHVFDADTSWVYVEGIIHPVDKPNTATKKGGVYKRHTATKQLNVIADARFKVGTTHTSIRVYQFYHNTPNDILQIWQPRVDKLDGTEPTRNQLLGIV